MIPRRITIDVRGWQPCKASRKRSGKRRRNLEAERKRWSSATLAERVIDRQVARASDG